jgi:EmrB/QacA subfamily drug resistance transporter
MTRKQIITLLATIIGSGIVILDGSIVNLALPKIALQLHASFSDLQWIVDGYLLSLSALILLGGSLGDIFGRKKVYVIGLIGFGISSLLCALAPTIDGLICLRILQGAFGALLVPGGLAIINTNFPNAKRATAIGAWSAGGAIFSPIGPILGGYLLGVGSWRLIFLINVPLVVVCAILAQLGIVETRDESPRQLDYAGAVLAMIGLAGLTYGFIEGPANHWHTASWCVLLLGVLGCAIFLYHQAHSRDPMVPLELFTSRNFIAANSMTFALYGALSGFLFALIIYLQVTLGYSSIKAGASILPLAIALFFLSRQFGKLSGRFGPRMFMTMGSILVGFAMASLYSLHSGDSYTSHVLPGIVLFGIGMSMVVAPLTITVMASVPDISSGIASGINNAISRVAGLLMIAVLGLFGSKQTYHFAIILSASLAVAAGVISFVLVQKITKVQHTIVPAAK